MDDEAGRGGSHQTPESACLRVFNGLTSAFVPVSLLTGVDVSSWSELFIIFSYNRTGQGEAMSPFYCPSATPVLPVQQEVDR